MQAQITHLKFKNTWQSQHGPMHCHEVGFSDGVLGEANSKNTPPPYQVGDTVEYNITGTDKVGRRKLSIQKQQPQQFQQQSPYQAAPQQQFQQPQQSYQAPQQQFQQPQQPPYQAPQQPPYQAPQQQFQQPQQPPYQAPQQQFQQQPQQFPPQQQAGGGAGAAFRASMMTAPQFHPEPPSKPGFQANGFNAVGARIGCALNNACSMHIGGIIPRDKIEAMTLWLAGVAERVEHMLRDNPNGFVNFQPPMQQPMNIPSVGDQRTEYSTEEIPF